jgi:hypothetical protein
VGRLANLYEQGRRFEVVEAVDQGDSVVVGLRVSQPDWSGTVEVFKRLTFRPGTGTVVLMQDCADRDAALSAAH